MKANGKRWKMIVTRVAMVFLGLTMLVSGTGKLPGQVEFTDVLMGSFWGPTMAWLIATLLPPAEIILGIALLLRIYPRIAAACNLPLIIGFITNNVWALMQGMDKFPQCGYCFGFFENIFGAVSPLQSLIIDIALLIAALLVLILYPKSFLTFNPWFLFGRKVGKSNEKINS